MIQPAPGVAFTWSDDGDVRSDVSSRRAVAAALGIGSEWATVDQVHGSQAHVVSTPTPAGDGDAVVTINRRMPVAVFTADCLGVVLSGPSTVAVAHAGWRGLAGGVLESASAAMAATGAAPTVAYIGPRIGPCCFEVGEEVSALFEGDASTTTWGTPSVDLTGAARRLLSGVEVWADERCTACGGGYSHRRDGTRRRMAAVGWIE